MTNDRLFAAIDLHSNNSYLVVTDSQDRVLHDSRIRNHLPSILDALSPFAERVEAVAVESTFNWYWLVDGLADAGFEVRLVNTTAAEQYAGLKFSDDRDDARWLARMLRLGILPCGFVMPREIRSLRDLLRKRMSLVRQRSANILSVENLFLRNSAEKVSVREVKAMTDEEVEARVVDPFRAAAIRSSLVVVRQLAEQIEEIERRILSVVRGSAEIELLRTIWGVGEILAMTVHLETGPVGRFASPGDYASYCRCVRSDRLSNGKRKGSGNDKCGNAYLSWAWTEAATYAMRFYPKANQFYQRKAATKPPVLARRALAHKLARAAWHVLSDGVPFAPERAFS